MFYFVKGPPPLFVEMRVSEVPANGVEQTEVVSGISIFTSYLLYIYFIIILIIIPIISSSQEVGCFIWNFEKVDEQYNASPPTRTGDTQDESILWSFSITITFGGGWSYFISRTIVSWNGILFSLLQICHFMVGFQPRGRKSNRELSSIDWLQTWKSLKSKQRKVKVNWLQLVPLLPSACCSATCSSVSHCYPTLVFTLFNL